MLSNVNLLQTGELKCLSVPNVFDLFVHKKPSFRLQDWAKSFFSRIFFVEDSKRILLPDFSHQSLCISYSCTLLYLD